MTAVSSLSSSDLGRLGPLLALGGGLTAFATTCLMGAYGIPSTSPLMFVGIVGGTIVGMDGTLLAIGIITHRFFD